jgi:Lrp/AsnC family leucine-responsive transcriptional regulator
MGDPGKGMTSARDMGMISFVCYEFARIFRILKGGRVMDATDEKIIAVLSQRARISLEELAGAVGLASPTVAERVKRLEEGGCILGYTAILDPRKFGYPLQALVRINPLPGTLHEVEKMIRSTPEFVECDRVTGEDCFIGRLYIRSIEELDPILDRFEQTARTNTAIVKGQPVKRRLPPFVSDSAS